MRRRDREVENREEILDILRQCETIRIGMRGEKFPYIVPVSFGMEVEDGSVIIYFHCARQGMKQELLRADPHVCVEGDIFRGIEKTPHGITARYESIIGFGECAFLSDDDEIIHGLSLLTEHYGYPDYPLDSCAGLSHLLIGKIKLTEIYGKKNLPGSMTPADQMK